MTRLPPRLQPLWPAVKRAHRAGARGLGAVSRRTGLIGRGLPARATATSRETAVAEPGSARYHVAGAAFRNRRPMPAGNEPGRSFFESRLEQDVPERFVLDLDEGTVIGPHVAVVTRGGLLDFETSHYNGLKDWREHPLFWNPRRVEPERFDGTLLTVAARLTSNNYYHFLMDALPRLGLCADALPDVAPDAYLVNRRARFHRELIGLLGLDRLPLIEPRRSFAVRADRLLVPSLPNVSTVASPETTDWLRENLPARSWRDKPERIYVTRGQTRNTRRVEREDEIFARLARRGFVKIDPGALSVQDQIDHFAAARVVVSPHGAALTNLNFCRAGVRVLELFAPGYLNPGYWSITGNIPGSRYRYLVAERPVSTGAGSPNSGVMHDIHVAPEAVDAALDELLEDGT